jgi:hypothetical protein
MGGIDLHLPEAQLGGILGLIILLADVWAIM